MSAGDECSQAATVNWSTTRDECHHRQAHALKHFSLAALALAAGAAAAAAAGSVRCPVV